MVIPSAYPGGMGVGKPRGLSPSSFSAFKDCPLAFRFSYLDRLPQPPSAAASKGTLVHRALELLMLRGPEARTIANAVVDLDQARAELASHPDFADLELTVDEWMLGVQFLNAVGQISHGQRNEGQRISDVIGLESYRLPISLFALALYPF